MTEFDLVRAAIFASTRIIHDTQSATYRHDLLNEVKEAYLSMFDFEVDESTPEARRKLSNAVSLTGDLINFGLAIKGTRNG